MLQRLMRSINPLSKALTLCALLSSPVAFAQVDDALSSINALKSLSIEELMEIEVTSVSKHPEKLSHSSSAIQIITADDIRHSGATSIPEALRLATNLQVAQVNSSQWAISARGFNNVLANKLLVLMDGRVVYTPMYAGVFWDVQNLLLEDIERIEVISGPGGTLWGANAVNGVINIITKNSSATQGLFSEVATGTELRGLASLRYGGKLADNLSYRIYGQAFRRDHTIFPDSVQAEDAWQMAHGGIRLDWTPSEKDLATFQTNLYDGRPDPDGRTPVVARGDNMLARWVHNVSDRSDFQVQAYYDHTWRDFRTGFKEQLRTYDLEGQHRFHVGTRHEVIYGAGFRALDHQVTNLELFSFLPANKQLYLYNLFLQDNITLVHDKLNFVAGLKVEHYTYSDFQYQPNVRLNWRPAPNQTLWSAASRAIRNPSRIDREFFLSLAPETPFVVGNNSDPEEVVSYELGWRSQPSANFTVSVASFYNEYDDLRGVEPVNPDTNIPVAFTNSVEGKSYGLEVSSTGQLTDWWRVRAGYTFFKKELSVKKGRSDANNASAESNDPTHQALVQSMMDLPEGVELGVVARYIGRLPDPPVAGYLEADVRIAWRILKNIELVVVGQNLLHASHLEFIPASPAPKHIQRGVYGKVICRL